MTVVLVAAPIIPILYQSILSAPIYDSNAQLTTSNFHALITSDDVGHILWNTLIFAGITTLVAELIGIFLAIVLARTDMPGRKLLGEVLLWPMFVSTLVLAFGWFLLYGPAGYATLFVQSLTGIREPWNLYSLAGMAFVTGISQVPLTLLYCQSSGALLDPSLEDAARTCGAGPWQVMRKVTLPMMRPAVLFSTVMNITLALETLAVPLVFGEPYGIRVLTTLLYAEGIASAQPNYGLVATAAVVLLCTIMLLVFIQQKLLKNNRRFVSVSGKASRPRLLALGNWGWVLCALTTAFALAAIILPLAALVLRGFVSFLSPLIPFWTVFTLENFAALFSVETYRRSILNTLLISTVGAVIGTAFMALIALVAHRSEFRLRGFLDFVAVVPRAVPGLVAGLGFFYAAILLPPIGWLRGTVFIIIVAYVMRYISNGYGTIVPSLLQIAPDIDRSARVMGADWVTACWAAVVPILKPALFSCFAVLFIQFFKEYTTAVFLLSPGSEVIGSTMLQFWVQGQVGRVAALSAVQLAITFAFVYASKSIFGLKFHG
ncbi:iron ABC transporter permease [Ensifer sp. YR511]|uniref:ABC transporter permease n=1 Tax=Ensifer sp. YR511 TaxID=1855294 RepID=UPI000884C9C4|nr:iron ABC transporter permease [Ensifer sp. YR511]SDO04936.1 iron(III) transport system permease protein [Ensifer sp. YR511]